jgi:hypothetical protein
MHSSPLARPSLAVLSVLLLSLLSLINAQTYYCTEDTPCVNGACCGISDGETQGVSLALWYTGVEG